MRAHELRPPHARKSRTRVGRGNSSGHGTYSGRGLKGQKARAGGGVRPSFEGGQLPKVKALPTLRGFTNIFKRRYHVLNVARLAVFPAGARVTPSDLARRGLVRDTRLPVKVLGKGDLDRPLTVEAHKFSGAARQKIEAAGGAVQEL